MPSIASKQNQDVVFVENNDRATHADNKRKEEGSRVPALTGVRGVAALIVVLQHSWLAHRDGIPQVEKLIHPFLGMWFGVDLFFVLSGYLLTGVLLRTASSTNYYKSFYARRCLRIWPAYYLLLFVALAFTFLNAGCRCNNPWVSFGWTATFMTDVYVLLKGSLVVMIGTAALNHLWSLAVEEHFYIFWPFVVKRVSAQRLLQLSLFGVAAVLAMRTIYFVQTHNQAVAYVLTPFRLDSFFVGALVACILSVELPRTLLRKWSRPALAGGMLMLTAFGWKTHFFQGDLLVSTIGYTVIALSFGSLIFALAVSDGRDLLSRAFAHPVLMFLGKYSYAIYLFHLPITYLINTELVNRHMATSTATVICLGIILPFICSFGLAVLSWQLVENRFLKLKDRFIA